MRGKPITRSRTGDQRIAEVFAELAGLSGGDADEATLLPVLADRCAELLGATAVGVALTDPDGQPRTAVGVAGTGAPRPSAQLLASGTVLPMQARGQTVGVLILVGDGQGPLDAGRMPLAQALVEAAASAIVSRRELHLSQTRAGQLQQALSSRVLIEQAKGILAERWQVDVTEAFDLLRAYARARNLTLREVARRVIQDGAQLPAPPDRQRST